MTKLSLVLINILNLIIVSNYAKDNNNIANYLYDSSITLKINKVGKSYIYNADINCYSYAPFFDEIYINGVNQSEIKNNYDFNTTDNNILLI